MLFLVWSPNLPRRRTRGIATNSCLIQTGQKEEKRLANAYAKLFTRGAYRASQILAIQLGKGVGIVQLWLL